MIPQLPIEIDDSTGVWTTDNLPMLYVPRHFFVNNHVAVEEALGRERYAQQLYDAGYKSAYFWCDKEAATHGLSGIAVFEHYLKRLSQRGWGLLAFESADAETGHARITLNHSVFVLAQPEAKGKLCYMFSGWFSGAMDWVGANNGRSTMTTSRETQCAAEGHSHCVFSVEPKLKVA
ncbi:MAG: 4-vinyl reductase [Herminiimonas sp.]|nr:4-vinyl reductase [Herminiimonas sp.]